MALLAKREGPKEQVRNAYSAFYRVLDGTVTSLRWPNDVTGDVGKRSIPQPGTGKDKKVGLRLLRTRGPSNRTGAKGSHTGVP